VGQRPAHVLVRRCGMSRRVGERINREYYLACVVGMKIRIYMHTAKNTQTQQSGVNVDYELDARGGGDPLACRRALDVRRARAYTQSLFSST